MKKFQVQLLVILLSVLQFSVVISDDECIPRSFGLDSIVCVCNATYCDTTTITKPRASTGCLVVTSDRAGLRLKQDVCNFGEIPESPNKEVIINADIMYQSIIGFGGAFTDSVGINVNSLSDGAKENLLSAYFSEKGIMYNMGRVPIGGTDFSTRGYSYDDGITDKLLINFQLAPEDHEYKIPLIKQALNLSNGNLRLMASAWTAPKWMKTNHEYGGFGFLKRTMYQVWADYFIKFLESYQNEELEFWGITTGNEPSLIYHPELVVSSVGWHSSGMSKWIANNLGPTLRKSDFFSIKLMALDDQRNYIPWIYKVLRESKAAKNFVDGIAIHWYNDKVYSPNILTQLHDHLPNKFILNTESSIVKQTPPKCSQVPEYYKGVRVDCSMPTSDTSKKKPVSLGSWVNAERYAHDIIQDLRHWVTGWIDWNIALNMEGGPTYTNNTIDSPIIVNAEADEFYKQPMFYAMAHFSKFIPRGSIRIDTTVNYYDNELHIVAFQRPDNATVITILNRKENYENIVIRDERRGSYNMSVGAKSINTIVYW